MKLKPNHLKNEKSPYLLQHAYNPINWYPWGREALEKAEVEDKPIFISIGYSTCHWCHVMAEESFEDNEVAELLNKHFIAIKVDREERPDVDNIYMNACVTMNGQGGWPLTIIASPQQKPFFAATYLPPRTAGGRTGLVEILSNVALRWQDESKKFKAFGEDFTKFLTDSLNTELAAEDVGSKLFLKSYQEYEKNFDKQNGGFGAAPKFPAPHNLMFLMRYAHFEKQEKAMEMVEKTLMNMYKGGIYDHIGSGFCRYSTDKYWLVPHFEKMLYDNALLTIAYLEAFQITGNELYREVAESTLEFVIRELTSTDGGFWTALDADINGEEGLFYAFTYEELIDLLGEENGKEFNKFFNITKQGNFDGKNVPNLSENKNPVRSQELKERIQAVYHYRKKRYSLHTDDKIITSLNALMSSAFIKAYVVMDKDAYLILAKKAMEFIENNLTDEDGNLYSVYREGRSNILAGLDDYAYYSQALIDIYEATFEPEYLKKAVFIAEKAMTNFEDALRGGCFMNDKRTDSLILRPKDRYDGAMPCGNSVLGLSLERLSKLTRNKQMEDLAQRQTAYLEKIADWHLSYGLIALMKKYYPSKEIIAVAEGCAQLSQLRELQRQFCPDTTFAAKFTKSDALYAYFFNDYDMKNNATTYYVCQNKTCNVSNNL